MKEQLHRNWTSLIVRNSPNFDMRQCVCLFPIKKIWCTFTSNREEGSWVAHQMLLIGKCCANTLVTVPYTVTPRTQTYNTHAHGIPMQRCVYSRNCRTSTQFSAIVAWKNHFYEHINRIWMNMNFLNNIHTHLLTYDTQMTTLFSHWMISQWQWVLI